MNMIAYIPTLAAFTIPQQLKDNVAYGLMIVTAIAAVWCIIKVIQGANELDRGEEGKNKIYSGLAVGIAPWLAKAAFDATGLSAKLGLTLVPSGVTALPMELLDTIQLSLWAIIGFAFVMAVIKCVGGAQQLERGEEGKQKIVSGIVIGAAPWMAIGALNLSGFWDALGLQLI